MPQSAVKKILFLGSQMETGGAQRVLLDQAGWFTHKGYTVEAAFFYDKEGLHTKWQDHPFPIHNLNAWTYKGNLLRNLFKLIGGLLRLWKILKQGNFDVIETFTPDSNLVGLPIARLAKVPLRIGTHHSYIEGSGIFRQRAHGWLVNSKITSHLVAVSQRVMDLAISKEKVNPKKVSVILNGIQPIEPDAKSDIAQIRKQLGIANNQLLIVSIGRLTVQKGHTYLIDAVKLLPDDIKKSIKVFIAGDGALKDDLENKIQGLGLQNKIQLLGIRSDVPLLLHAADIFILPSLWEGLPIVILEAMSAGKAIIASDVEGIQDALENNASALIVPPKDPAALMEKIKLLSNDPNLQRSLGQQAHTEFNNKFTLDQMCMNYETLFLQINDSI